MSSDSCDIENCQSDANFMCNCANPETFLCSTHISKHLQDSPGPHHAIKMNSEKKIQTKSETIDYLSKQIEKLKKLKKNLYKEIASKIQMIEASLLSCTKKIDRKISSISLKIIDLISSDEKSESDTNLNSFVRLWKRRSSLNIDFLDQRGSIDISLPEKKASVDVNCLRRGSFDCVVNETVNAINNHSLQTLMREINLFMRSAERIKVHEWNESPISSRTLDDSITPVIKELPEAKKKKYKRNYKKLEKNIKVVEEEGNIQNSAEDLKQMEEKLSKSESLIKSDEKINCSEKQNPINLINKESESKCEEFVGLKSKPLQNFSFKNMPRINSGESLSSRSMKIEVRASLECCSCGEFFDSSEVFENFCGCLTCSKCNILEIKKCYHMRGYFVNEICKVCQRQRQVTGHRW